MASCTLLNAASSAPGVLHVYMYVHWMSLCFRAGVKPRYHLVPCPHCASFSNHGNSSGSEVPHQVHLLRSFSTDASLQGYSNEGEGLMKGTAHTSGNENGLSSQPSSVATKVPSPESSPAPSHVTPITQSQKPLPASVKSPFSKSPWRQLTQLSRKPRGGATPSPPMPDPSRGSRGTGGGRYLEPEHGQRGFLDPYNYAFRYDDCVVTARNQDYVTCPAHGKILLRYMAPDTVHVHVVGGEPLERRRLLLPHNMYIPTSETRMPL